MRRYIVSRLSVLLAESLFTAANSFFRWKDGPDFPGLASDLLSKICPTSRTWVVSGLWCKNRRTPPFFFFSPTFFIETFPPRLYLAFKQAPQILNPPSWLITLYLRPQLKQIILFVCAQPPFCHVSMRACVCAWVLERGKVNTDRLRSSWSCFLSADVAVFLPLIREERADCEF